MLLGVLAVALETLWAGLVWENGAGCCLIMCSVVGGAVWGWGLPGTSFWGLASLCGMLVLALATLRAVKNGTARTGFMGWVVSRASWVWKMLGRALGILARVFLKIFDVLCIALGFLVQALGMSWAALVKVFDRLVTAWFWAVETIGYLGIAGVFGIVVLGPVAAQVVFRDLGGLWAGVSGLWTDGVPRVYAVASVVVLAAW